MADWNEPRSTRQGFGVSPSLNGAVAARPAAAMLFLFTFVGAWNQFFWPFIVLDRQSPTLPVALSLLQGNYFVDYSIVLAGVLLSTIPLLILFVFAGKQLGVFAFSWAAIRWRFADRPARASWLQLYGVSILCGVGFTMSLFIGLLAFPGAPALADQVKIGVIAGSALSAVVGAAVLFLAGSRQATT